MGSSPKADANDQSGEGGGVLLGVRDQGKDGSVGAFAGADGGMVRAPDRWPHLLCEAGSEPKYPESLWGKSLEEKGEDGKHVLLRVGETANKGQREGGPAAVRAPGGWRTCLQWGPFTRLWVSPLSSQPQGWRGEGGGSQD